MSGFLQKLHLVEEVSNTGTEEWSDAKLEAYSASAQNVTIPTDTVNLNEVKSDTLDTLIDDIYSGNNLSDKTKSIFKVEELRGTLPKEMRTDAMKQTVLGIMNVSELNVDDIVKDGIDRVDILQSANTQISNDCDKEVSDANAEIESLKTQIEEKQKTIALTETKKEKSIKLISDEVNRIEELCKFIASTNTNESEEN